MMIDLYLTILVWLIARFFTLWFMIPFGLLGV